MYNTIQDLINNPEPGNSNDQGIVYINKECIKEYPCKHRIIFKSKSDVEYDLGICNGLDIYKLIQVQRNYIYSNEENSKNDIDEHFSYLKRGIKINRRQDECIIQ